MVSNGKFNGGFISNMSDKLLNLEDKVTLVTGGARGIGK